MAIFSLCLRIDKVKIMVNLYAKGSKPVILTGA